MELAIAAPILFPWPRSGDVLTLRFDLAPDLVGPLTTRMRFGKLRRASPEFDILKDASQRIVVLNGNRVELMIVTASAAQGNPHHGSAHRLHDFVHTIGPGLSNRRRLASHSSGWHVRTRYQETGRFSRIHRIARQLLAHELVVRLILVEGADHIVPVAPGILTVQIRFRTVRLRPPNDIQPMLGPAFPEMRRRHQFVHQVFVGLVCIALVRLFECRDPFRSRGQTRQDDRCPTN